MKTAIDSAVYLLIFALLGIGIYLGLAGDVLVGCLFVAIAGLQAALKRTQDQRDHYRDVAESTYAEATARQSVAVGPFVMH